MDDDILIIDDDQEVTKGTAKCWKILIVDDEPEVHHITTVTLSQFTFDEHSIQFLHAYSAKEACQVLASEKDIALVLLDVVMETDSAGLDVVKFIRDDIKNSAVRIVLRTGQPGQAPEDDVVDNYDINDYKDKTELTSQKLRTLIRASLRSYRDIGSLEKSRIGLEKVIQASRGIFNKIALQQFVTGALEQLSALLELEDPAVYAVSTQAYKVNDTKLELFAQDSHELTSIVKSITDFPKEVQPLLRQAIEKQENIYAEHTLLIFCRNSSHSIIFHVEGSKPLEELDTHLLNLFTRNITIALENVRLNEVIFDNQKEFMYRLGEVIESRSKESGQHVKRVAHYSALLGQLYGVDPETNKLLKQASPLHDIGKVGIPDAILHKPGKLDTAEWKIMKTHAQIGYDMLESSDIPMLKMGAEIALTHHERWDGHGYPNGLKGMDIPITGRITALADVFDALGSPRCYKEAWELDDILDYLKSQKNQQFEGKLVELLLDNLPKFIEICKMCCKDNKTKH